MYGIILLVFFFIITAVVLFSLTGLMIFILIKKGKNYSYIFKISTAFSMVITVVSYILLYQIEVVYKNMDYCQEQFPILTGLTIIIQMFAYPFISVIGLFTIVMQIIPLVFIFCFFVIILAIFHLLFLNPKNDKSKGEKTERKKTKFVFLKAAAFMLLLFCVLYVFSYLNNGRKPLFKSEVKQSAELFKAIENGDQQAIEKLLSEGIDLNTTFKYRTPLFLATEKKDYQLMEMLISNGADVNQTGYSNRTPLNQCIDNLELTQLLIENGADTEIKDDDGNTPLIRALDRGYYDVAIYLLNNGASPHVEINRIEDTPLFLAYEGALKGSALDIEKCYTILQILFDKGIKINSSKPPYYLLGACQNRYAGDNLIKLFLDNGADLQTRDSDGRTALILVTSKNLSLKRIRMLVEYGSDVNAKDNYGITSLMYLVKNVWLEDINSIKFLIRNGANVNLKDSENKTALIHAVSTDFRNEKIKLPLIKYLLQNGADIKVKNKWGETALQIAQRKENAAIVKLLKSYAPN